MLTFEPTRASVDTHPLPAWYEDAKFGIFIHWSLFSVPAYAKRSESNINEMSEGGGFDAMLRQSPYAEWYLNSLRIKGSPTEEYHAQRFGEHFDYFDFQRIFEQQAANLQASEWAGFFKEAGAQYVVMVTKHHDGYLLWPSSHPNPLRGHYFSKRDYVGEVTRAVREAGLKMGLYYSGVFDWTFKDYPISSLKTFVEQQNQEKRYLDYATSHLYELIDRYAPSVLWNDIGYPDGYNLNELFAYYYNHVEDGVVNDRWNQLKFSRNASGGVDIDATLGKLQKQLEADGIWGLLKPSCHHDFTTPEYASLSQISSKKWEMTRGIGKSFGFNAQETEADMLTGQQIIYMLADTVSKNGNMLLNVGPMADGTIPRMQRDPLLAVGRWLKVNGGAIYKTRSWRKAEGATADGKPVRFTSRDGDVYAIVTDPYLGGSLTLTDLPLREGAQISLLGMPGTLAWQARENAVTIALPERLPESYAYSFQIRGAV